MRDETFAAVLDLGRLDPHSAQAAHEFGLRDVGCKPYATEQPNDKTPARYFSHPTLLIELYGAVILSGAAVLLLKLGDYNRQPTDLICPPACQQTRRAVKP